MNISRITIDNKNRTMHSSTTAKSSANFGHVIYDYKLSSVFASPTYAEPFVQAVRKLQKIPINLKEILDYENLSVLKKTICDEYFSLIGESEVLNHTVRLKPVFEYSGGCEKYPMRSGIKLFATLPAWRSDYYDAARDGLELDDNPQFGFIDRTGNMVVKPQFDHVQEFREGLAPVEMNGKWGYIDKKGDVIIPLEYDYVPYPTIFLHL